MGSDGVEALGNKNVVTLRRTSQPPGIEPAGGPSERIEEHSPVTVEVGLGMFGVKPSRTISSKWGTAESASAGAQPSRLGDLAWAFMDGSGPRDGAVKARATYRGRRADRRR